MDEVLARSIQRACEPESLYMMFLDAQEEHRDGVREIEIRIDVAPNRSSELIEAAAREGWHLPRTLPDGRVFLRRNQSLTEPSLHELFREALSLAYRFGGRFHSWLHAPGLDENG